MKDPDAVKLGSKGGKSKSAAKVAAARANGKKGGRKKESCFDCGRETCFAQH